MADGYQYLDRESALEFLRDVRSIRSRMDKLTPEQDELLTEMELVAENADLFISRLRVVDMGMMDDLRRRLVEFEQWGGFRMPTDGGGDPLLN